MNIGFFISEDWEEEYFSKKAKECGIGGIEFIKGILDKDHIHSGNYDGIVIFVDSKIDEAVINSLPNLKFIATRSTGFDHIDIEICKQKNITIVNVPAYGANTVAEHAFALLLTLSKKIYISYDQIRKTGSFALDGLRGFDLEGKTIGIIGTGNIGLHSIKIANGFGMNVIAYDVNKDDEKAQKYNFVYKDCEKVLAESDIVTLHVPYNKHTHHFMDRQKIYNMKKGAFLINTSRGGIVETSALVSALKDKHLGGAGLDVLEEEGAIHDELSLLTEGHPEEHNLKTILSNHVLIDMPNVIITPHNAFNTEEALKRILDTTLDNIKSIQEGSPINIVTVN